MSFTQNEPVRAPQRGRSLAQRLGRRRVIVDRQLQWGLALRSATFVSGLLCVVAFGLFLPLTRTLSEDALARSVHAAEDRATVMLYLHERFWPIALLAISLAILISLLTSNRIAGPLVRVKRHLRMLGGGLFPRPLRTRSKDYLKQEVETLNQAVESLAHRHVSRCEAFEDLEQAFGRCVDLTEDGAAPQFEAPLRILGDELERLRDELGVGSERTVGEPRRLGSRTRQRETAQ